MSVMRESTTTTDVVNSTTTSTNHCSHKMNGAVTKTTTINNDDSEGDESEGDATMNKNPLESLQQTCVVILDELKEMNRKFDALTNFVLGLEASRTLGENVKHLNSTCLYLAEQLTRYAVSYKMMRDVGGRVGDVIDTNTDHTDSGYSPAPKRARLLIENSTDTPSPLSNSSLLDKNTHTHCEDLSTTTTTTDKSSSTHSPQSQTTTTTAVSDRATGGVKINHLQALGLQVEALTGWDHVDGDPLGFHRVDPVSVRQSKNSSLSSQSPVRDTPSPTESNTEPELDHSPTIPPLILKMEKTSDDETTLTQRAPFIVQGVCRDGGSQKSSCGRSLISTMHDDSNNTDLRISQDNMFDSTETGLTTRNSTTNRLIDYSNESDQQGLVRRRNLLIKMDTGASKKSQEANRSSTKLILQYSKDTSNPPVPIIPADVCLIAYKMSCSRTNFSVRLLRELFTWVEMEGHNVNGRMGKSQLDPIRTQAIRNTTFQWYPVPEGIDQDAVWVSECVQGIDKYIRNTSNYKKNKHTLPTQVHI